MILQQPRAASPRIILLDDDAAYAALAKQCLTSLGYRVCVFASFVAAIEELQMARDGVAVFFMPLNMSAINGPDVVRLVRERFPDQRCVILSTNLQSSNLVSRAMREDVFLAVKPTTPQDFSRLLDDIARLPVRNAVPA